MTAGTSPQQSPSRTPGPGRLGPGDAAALGSWLWTRLAVLVLSLAGGWALTGSPAGQVAGPLERWARYDVDLFRKIAEFGYGGYPERFPDVGLEAFFPGFPLLLRAVHAVVPDWTAAGLLISLLAGGVAMVALARLAALDGVDGNRAVLYLLLSPYAVFLAAGYSEALFLALALPGWLAARTGRWPAAGLLVAAACTVRVSGLFLAVALVVQYLVAHRGRPRPEALWLLAPFGAILAYVGYLYVLTGDWLRWPHAQEEGWDRRLTAPWEAFTTTLGGARDPGQPGDFALSFGMEILAVAAGVALTVVLVRRRRWAEATYLGLSVTALATSTFYLSVARTTLLWFPLWILLAAAGTRWRAVHTAYLAVAAPLMVLFVLAFTSGRWVG